MFDELPHWIVLNFSFYSIKIQFSLFVLMISLEWFVVTMCCLSLLLLLKSFQFSNLPSLFRSLVFTDEHNIVVAMTLCTQCAILICLFIRCNASTATTCCNDLLSCSFVMSFVFPLLSRFLCCQEVDFCCPVKLWWSTMVCCCLKLPAVNSGVALDCSVMFHN